MARRNPDEQRNRAFQAELEKAIDTHPLLGRMDGELVWRKLPHEVSARVVDATHIHLNADRRFSIPQWLWHIAHARLHIALGHPWDVRRSFERPLEFAVARCLAVNDLLFQLGIGAPPSLDGRPLVRESLPEREVGRLVMHLQTRGIPEHCLDCGGVHGGPDVIGDPPAYTAEQLANPSPWDRSITRESSAAHFASAIRNALEDSIDRAGGLVAEDTKGRLVRGPAALASRWIRTHLPIIGALLDRFRIIEDVEVCRRLDIPVAAVCDGNEEIYLNKANLNGEMEYRFVLAHELLHAGLRHGDRCGGRDPLWWNAACDFVINGWLVEMGVGRPPAIGGLYDPALKGKSSEQVYDIIHATMSEKDLEGFATGGDIRARRAGASGDWADLDGWCRNAMLNGLELHQAGRGLLPAGLVEAIRAMAQPPIQWDVELARWFEREVGQSPQRRTYARPSRRQASTPDIPRPRWQPDDEAVATFATVIDTSGSMDRILLGKALGAVASYALAREVRQVRVVFCDAVAYDAGWMAPEQLLERVDVKGRGGTRLQPGIDLVERAKDFPSLGPILIITDGYCDHFQCHRSHAILTPTGARLPFVPRGEVFRLQ
jgi:predicted metal-dependent peptidase